MDDVAGSGAHAAGDAQCGLPVAESHHPAQGTPTHPGRESTARSARRQGPGPHYQCHPGGQGHQAPGGKTASEDRRGGACCQAGADRAGAGAHTAAYRGASAARSDA